MPTTKTATASSAGIIAAEPIILVTDLDAALTFYCDKLGFRVALCTENQRSTVRSVATVPG